MAGRVILQAIPLRWLERLKKRATLLTVGANHAQVEGVFQKENAALVAID
jgi:hypothetical protein